MDVLKVRNFVKLNFRSLLSALFIFGAAGVLLSCVKSPPSPANNVTVATNPEDDASRLPKQKTVFSRILDRFSSDEKQEPLVIDGYRFEVVKTLKKDKTVSDADDPVEISDGRLLLGKKQVLEFRGLFNPLGNEMLFDVADLTGDGQDELVVTDISNGWTRNWIVSMKPKPRVIFDSKDYDLWHFGVDSQDLNGDGIPELAGHVESGCGLASSRNSSGQMTILFRFDSKKGKFIPAWRSLPPPEWSDRGQELRDFLSRFGELAYAGRQDEAWAFFESDWRSDFREISNEEDRDKDKAREILKDWLATDKTYQKIKRMSSR